MRLRNPELLFAFLEFEDLNSFAFPGFIWDGDITHLQICVMISSFDGRLEPSVSIDEEANYAAAEAEESS